MYKRILVPLDGSLLAEMVLPLVRTVAQSFKSSVELLTVIAPGSLYDRRTGKEHIFHEDLARVAKTFQDAGIKATYNVVEGDPAERIIAAADAEPDTLIAMSTHGRSGLQRLVLGSVMDRVAHHALSSMLIVSPQAQGAAYPLDRLATAVVPLDGSPLAEQALPVARQLAAALSLHLTLVRAVPLPVVYADLQYAAAMGNYYEESIDASRDEALAYLERTATAQRQAGIANVATIASIGVPATVIVDTANALPAGITVMTSRGRSGAGRWLLGSVADRVIRTSDRPVLLVRPGQTKKA